MAIINKQKAGAVIKAKSTHFDNLEKVVVEEQSEFKLKNQQESEMLIDPEEDEGGSTHTSVKAKAKVVKAEAMAAMESPDDVEESEEVIKEEPVVEETIGQNVAVIDSDIDPAEGYLEVASDDSEDSEDDDGDGSEDVQAEVVELVNEEKPQSLVVSEDSDESWDADERHDNDIFYDSDESPEHEEEIDKLEDEDDEEEEVKAEKGDEFLDLVDVDNTDDEGSEAIFASYGNKLMVIKGNRIVASMNKKAAIEAGHLDVYLGLQFEQVVASELSKQGLRAGLKAMGFVMAKVNVASALVINQRVAKQVTASTASMHKVVATKEKAFQDSLAIAAVGLNRGRWKDISNPLKASLQEELTSAGVRNANRLVHNVFAQHGISYAKAICAMATRLAAMPQGTRDSLTASLDMTNEMDDEDSDLYGVSSGDEEMPDQHSEDEFSEDEMEDHAIMHSSVTATLTNAGFKNKAAVLTHKSTQYSVSASDILSGKAKLSLF